MFAIGKGKIYVFALFVRFRRVSEPSSESHVAARSGYLIELRGGLYLWSDVEDEGLGEIAMQGHAQKDIRLMKR